MLHFNVAHIVIQYLEPLCLRNFFVQNGLNLGMKFVCDSSNNQITYRDLCVVFEDFPNAILVGVMIDFLKLKSHKKYKYLNRFDKLLCCGLYGCGYENYYGCSLELLECINRTTNIIVLNLKKCLKIRDIVNICKKVKKIIIGKERENYSPNLCGLAQCTELEKIIINDNIILNAFDLQELSRCNKLTYLKIRAVITQIIMLNCKKLRVLKIKNSNVYDLWFIEGCSNLKHLVISGCNNLKHINILMRLCYLESLVVRECENLLDVSILDDDIWQKLRRVKIIKCVNLVRGFSVKKVGWIISGCPKLLDL